MPKKKVLIIGPWGSMSFMTRVLEEKKKEGRVKFIPQKDVNLSAIALNARLVLPRVSLSAAKIFGRSSVSGRKGRKKGTYFSG